MKQVGVLEQSSFETLVGFDNQPHYIKGKAMS